MKKIVNVYEFMGKIFNICLSTTASEVMKYTKNTFLFVSVTSKTTNIQNPSNHFVILKSSS